MAKIAPTDQRLARQLFAFFLHHLEIEAWNSYRLLALTQFECGRGCKRWCRDHSPRRKIQCWRDARA